MIPQVDLRRLPFIFHLAVIKEIRRAAFALQKIAAVFLVAEQPQHHRRRPRFSFSAWRRNAPGGQLPCDDVSAFAVHQETAVHLADDCRLLGIHCQFPTPQGKPVDIIASEHHTTLHRALLPPLDALRDFAALLLRYACHYGKPEFTVILAGVDMISNEYNTDSLTAQQPRVRERVNRISGKA